jgi:mRNA-degrading endonuclease toxin of MazEF toxin-antitoxin module
MKKIFHSSETRPAGSVFPIPLKARHIRDNKRIRPFLLLSRVAGEELGTLALMTTTRTETLHRAPMYEVEDRRGKQSLPGQEESLVDLTSFIFRRADALIQSGGTHARHLPAIRKLLKSALGIGSGVGPGGTGQSIRGHLVRMSAEIAEMYAFGFGVVLTQHEYSAARRLQALVPVMDMGPFLSDGDAATDFERVETDVIPVPTAAWIRQLPLEWRFPFIDTARLASFTERWQNSRRPETWLDRQIVEVYPVPVDAASLDQVESALANRLRLPV